MSEGKAWRGTRGRLSSYPESNRTGLLRVEKSSRFVAETCWLDAEGEEGVNDNTALLAAAWNACQAIAGPEGNPLKVAGALEEIVRAAQGFFRDGPEPPAVGELLDTIRLGDALRKAGLL